MSLFTSYTHLTNKPKNTPQGFTIVELLIVIVVIAILAAISIVSYNGIQQRAKNTAIINAASQTIRVVEAYIAANDKYPYSLASGSGWGCITTDTICYWGAGSVIPESQAFNTNIVTIGKTPTSSPNGVFFYWYTPWTYDGTSRPFTIGYYLDGVNQLCGIPGVIVMEGDILKASTTGYTAGNELSGKTRCMISIPGPSV